MRLSSHQPGDEQCQQRIGTGTEQPQPSHPGPVPAGFAFAVFGAVHAGPHRIELVPAQFVKFVHRPGLHAAAHGEGRKHALIGDCKHLPANKPKAYMDQHVPDRLHIHAALPVFGPFNISQRGAGRADLPLRTGLNYSNNKYRKIQKFDCSFRKHPNRSSYCTAFSRENSIFKKLALYQILDQFCHFLKTFCCEIPTQISKYFVFKFNFKMSNFLRRRELIVYVW